MPPALLIALAALLLAAPPAAAADPLRDRQWGLDMVEADGARSASTGAGATVAIVDSGVRLAHPDLAERLLPGRDFVDGDTTPEDHDGHGTHVAGIVGAVTGNGVGIASVAPSASLLPVRVLNDRGRGSTEDVAAGIDWARRQGADVINLSLGEVLSLGRLGISSELDAAVGRALAAGIVVVAAAGNNGLPLCEQSAHREQLLCVGAVDREGRRAWYSSFAEGRGVMAPGGAGTGDDDDVLSTWTSPDYQVVAGTSQATPHAAGVAALLVSLGVRGAAATQRVRETAVDAGPRGVDAQYGHGIVNARAAVAGLDGGSASTGGGPTGSEPAAGAPASDRRVAVRMAWRARAWTVYRRGLRARCTAPADGRCRVSVFHGGRRIATGVRSVRAGRRTTVTIRASRYGRRLLRRAARRDRTLRARVRVSATRADARTRRLTIVG